MPLSTAELDALAATDVRQPLSVEALLPALTSAPFVPSKSLFNLRDLGTALGSELTPKRIYRSGFLATASKDPEALAWLAGHVRRIFDLRLGTERESLPDPTVPGVDNVWFEPEDGYPMPSLDEFAADGGRTAWKAEYMNCVLAYRPTIRAVLEHVRDRPTEPILVHCTAGRDRTGVVAGLLHALGGTPPEDAARDYMLSRIGTEPAREKLLQYAMGTLHITDPERPGFYDLVSLRPEFWDAFLEGLNERFGGWDGYVTEWLGLPQADLEIIKANLRA